MLYPGLPEKYHKRDVNSLFCKYNADNYFNKIFLLLLEQTIP